MMSLSISVLLVSLVTTGPPGSRPAERHVLADFDGDQRQDVYVVRAEGRDQLFRNRGDGTFEDVTAAAGLVGHRASRLALFEDVDGDHALDLLLVAADGVKLLRNTGAGSFDDITGASGLSALGELEGAHWIDYDQDRLPDLRVMGNGGDRLFHNRGSGRFDVVSFTPTREIDRDRLPDQPAPITEQPGQGSTQGSHDARESLDERPASGAELRRYPAHDDSPSPPDKDPMPGRSVPASPGRHDGIGNPGLTCAESLRDQGVTGACLKASSTPTLGLLYPLSSDLFVDAAGNVGINTLAPAFPLDVDGDSRVRGSLEFGFSGANLSSDQGGSIELGPATGNGQTPFIDFHYGKATNQDFNVRLRNQNDGMLEVITPGGTLANFDGTVGTFDVSGKTRTQQLFVERTNHDVLAKVEALGSNHGEAALWFKTASDPIGWYLFMDDKSLNHLGEADRFCMYYQGKRVLLLDGSSGFVGINTTAPTRQLDVAGNSRIQGSLEFGSSGAYLSADQGGSIELGPATGSGQTPFLDFHYGKPANQDFNVRLRNSGDQVLDLVTTPNGTLVEFNGGTGTVDVHGTTRTDVLVIDGGADLVEPFASASHCEPGTVVVIDDAEPGQVERSGIPYDRHVAGIVSGAGGVKPGIQLSQEGVTIGDTLVAMTGRVYVKATSENGTIAPGDLLTTASLPGHAMKATDFERSFGAVIGKAMSGLERGTGLVLVLVNLQ